MRKSDRLQQCIVKCTIKILPFSCQPEAVKTYEMPCKVYANTIIKSFILNMNNEAIGINWFLCRQ